MFHDVPASNKILKGYHKLTPSGFRPLTSKIHAIIDETDKHKKGGKGSKKREKKTVVKEGTSVTVKPPPKRKAPIGTSTAAPKMRK